MNPKKLLSGPSAFSRRAALLLLLLATSACEAELLGGRAQGEDDDEARPGQSLGGAGWGGAGQEGPDGAVPGAGSNAAVPGSPDDPGESLDGPPRLSLFDQCSSDTARGGALDSVRRLSRGELHRVLQTAFPSLFEWRTFPDDYYVPGSDVMRSYPPEVPEDRNEHFEPLHSEAQIQSWMETADQFGKLVAESEQELGRYGSDCIKDQSIDRECWVSFVERLGRVLYRRPLNEEDVDLAMQLVPSDGSSAAVPEVVAFLLRSPHVIFHVAQGEDESEGRLRVDSFTVAERLSFALTGTPPDDELSQAADEGQLESVEQVLDQARRLLGSPYAQARMRDFVDEWLEVNRIPRPHRAQSIAGWTRNTTDLDKFYRREIESYVNHVMFEIDGTFADLMSLPIGFPTKKLVDVYGQGESVDDEPVPTPDHPGLLLKAGFLASALNLPSPILRGVKLLRRVMCSTLPSPDATVVATRLSEVQILDPEVLPNHEIVSEATSPGPCMTCHTFINPLGFVLESFNPLGMKVDEQIYRVPHLDQGPKTLATFPLPGPQTFVFGEESERTYSQPNELVEVISESQQAKSCMLVRFFRSTYRRPEEPEDACALRDALDAMTDDVPVREALAHVVANEDIFWRKP